MLQNTADNRTAYFFILGNVSDLESGFYDHVREIFIFQLIFKNLNYIKTFFSV